MYGNVGMRFILVCVIIISVKAVSANSMYKSNGYFSLAREKRQSCSSNEIKCTTGGCTLEENECDGKVDCPDESDEANCKNFRCTSNFFQCKYGACVSKEAFCNGKKDCKDNSDEPLELCEHPGTTQKSEDCGTNQFRCNSGDCINEEFLCDGKPQCPDNSDESLEECKKIPCIKRIFFRCDYGACVPQSGRCDGIRDCFDGSDERGCPHTTTEKIVTPILTVKPPTKKPPTPKPTPTPTPPIIPGGCLIPPYPENGEYTIGNSKAIPGGYAPPFGVLLVKCKHPFNTSPPISKGRLPFCINSQWTIPPHKCSRACTALPSSPTTTFICKHLGETLDNCDNPVQGTTASVECALFHEQPEASQNPNNVCKDGTWDYHSSYCLPVCGEKRPKGTTNIINGNIAIKGDYPWHVGIYTSTNDNICGGSIISKKIVLSAAHCFTDKFGKLKPVDDYKIATGKYYRFYDDPRDEYAQYSFIKNIYIPERFKGIDNNYESDIAVLVLTDDLKFTIVVQPVCVDWATSFEKLQLIEDNVGVVVGWGQTVAGSAPSVELKELHVPYKTYSDCYDQVPEAFKKYITHDKMCAGYLSKQQAVCQGDSGGGLVFQRNQNRYYIRGIVSTSPTSKESGVDTCDANQYGTYTRVSNHILFISDIETANRS